MLGQTKLGGTELNVYAAPAILTLILLVVETVFLAIALPETRGKRLLHVQSSKKEDNGRSSAVNADRAPPGDTKVMRYGRVKEDDIGATAVPVRPAEQRIKTLKSLRMFHFLFLGIFSGVEFTLTFLTFDRA
jgi:hypothetical protein